MNLWEANLSSSWHWHFEEVSILESGTERYLALLKKALLLLSSVSSTSPSPRRKSTVRKCFFHRCITPLHGRPTSFASLPLEPPTQRQVAFRSFSVFYPRSSRDLSTRCISLSLSLFSFFPLSFVSKREPSNSFAVETWNRLRK